MSAAEPRDVAASVRDRLLTRARERGEDFQLVLIQYAVERLLYRLSRSPYRDQFLVKGAMLFLVWAGLIYRPTRDLDLLGRGENDVKRMAKLFRDVCAVPVEDDGLQFLADTMKGEVIRKEEDYEGVRLRFTAELAEARIPVQVDVAFGDAVSPAPEETEYPTMLPFPAPRVGIYPRESVVAEKFQIMVALGVANSRMKDFADVWTLASSYKFEGRALAGAIGATFARRRTSVPQEPPLALTGEFAEDRDKRAQWAAFLGRGRLEGLPRALPDVIGLVRDFVMPPARAVARGERFALSWPAGGRWRRAGGRSRRRAAPAPPRRLWPAPRAAKRA